MNWINENMEILLIASPVILIHLFMFAYCALLIRKEGVANLNRTLWLAICFFFQILGPIAFMIIGRKGE
ncbi:MAG: PLDc N-terminal domain-containing protein [Erysipelotrichaceae bacterium]|nr:PLDc N-terminal domain-containing protein [Erysipelotrichaceae bacterium]